MTSIQGSLLVASPHLSDPNFFRSVVLVVQHDAEGAFGLILNRCTENCVGEVTELVSPEGCSAGLRIQHGGPVQGPLTGIHTNPAYSENELLPGLYFTADEASLSELIQGSDHLLLVFSGYAGWMGGQLESELQAGGWFRTLASVDDVFSEQVDLWQRIARRIGLEILAPSIDCDRVPTDPSLN